MLPIVSLMAAAFVSIEPWTPPQLERLMRVDELRSTLTERAVGCDSAPEAIGVALLLAVFALGSRHVHHRRPR